ncbi:MAG: alcohol dehydrogenase catalytic domain-containing protein [Candidatus Latescibacteria bacterium]|nr:alcohol dehydrogenase catalytic domain-containing protein [Candidatus Latescibacterota bacterium]
MRAAVCYEFGKPLVVEEIEIDPPRMVAAAICHSDVHLIRGEWNKEILPVVAGHEAAGVVEEVGEGVDGPISAGSPQARRTDHGPLFPTSAATAAR